MNLTTAHMYVPSTCMGRRRALPQKEVLLQHQGRTWFHKLPHKVEIYNFRNQGLQLILANGRVQVYWGDIKIVYVYMLLLIE